MKPQIEYPKFNLRRFISAILIFTFAATSIPYSFRDSPKQPERCALGQSLFSCLAPRTQFEDSGEVKPGARFGKYKILKKLGKGGMGEAYLAEDTQLSRPVILKVISDRLKDNAEVVNVFKREAQIQARLDHPSIPKVYETGAINGVHFISMQYVEGKTLESILKKEDDGISIAKLVVEMIQEDAGEEYLERFIKASKNRLDLKIALAIAEKIARALDYVHEQRIVHLDIKPENILVDKAGSIYILDFGIAEVLPEKGGPVKLDSLRGTLFYISPDQIRYTVDRRSDIYSLGSVLYEMLTGRPPFLLFLYYDKHSKPPLPTKFNPEIPKGVEAIMLKALSGEPNDRYRTAGEFADAIRRCLTSDKSYELTVNNAATRESP